ncbi:MAG TPA: DUF4097 family beta strand repeat-containing protein [Elusimicrobiales bacterium]|jgi:DUF4097 and DUF4098 domain-containing protein YvlB|nr:DUF4097 family beta strand repeat-containing protein [Elusimicrobiales bacterium]HPO94793.1 DUF4097 family beta strand repeat-containing protein [Elusimicrobiales bacterium]
MIRRLIELMVLLILVLGFVYLLSVLNSANPDIAAKTIEVIKWGVIIVFGFLTIIVIGVVLIAVVAIIFGVSWLKKEKFLNISDIISSKAKDFDMKNYQRRKLNIDISDYKDDIFEVKSAIGGVKIEGTDDKKATIEAEIYEKEEGETELYIENGVLSLKTASGNKSKIGEVSAKIPNNLKEITAVSTNGDIEISHMKSKEITIKNVSGDIKLSDCYSDEATVKSVNSDIIISGGEHKEVYVKNINGDVLLENSKIEEASVKTVNGNIKKQNSEIKKQNFKVLRGNIY